MQNLETVNVDITESDVAEEQHKVATGAYDGGAAPTPVVIRQLRKQYGSRHGPVAVSGLSVAMENNICFGLLGPNGVSPPPPPPGPLPLPQDCPCLPAGHPSPAGV